MELDSQRVWDYTRDEYVHRLVANYDDNKIVEVPNFNWELELANTVKRKDLELGKEEALQLEWQYVLDAHLETQKRFFEERLAQIESQFQSKIKNLEKENAVLSKETEANSKKKVEQEKQTKILEKKIETLTRDINLAKGDTNFNKTIYESDRKNLHTLQELIRKREQDLQDQNNRPLADENVAALQREAEKLRLSLM